MYVITLEGPRHVQQADVCNTPFFCSWNLFRLDAFPVVSVGVQGHARGAVMLARTQTECPALQQTAALVDWKTRVWQKYEIYLQDSIKHISKNT